MNESVIIDSYEQSLQNAKARAEAVNSLRHLAMDAIAIDVSDDAAYMSVYERIMEHIASRFPSLSWEVKRQMAKKKRRQARRSLDKPEERLHLRAR